MLSRLLVAALSSPAGKELISLLLFVMFSCVFVTFPCVIRGQVWYLIASILIFTAFLTLEKGFALKIYIKTHRILNVYLF